MNQLAFIALIISISSILVVQAVPYPVLETEDVSQIPYCLNQLGAKCLVCGPIRDKNDTSVVLPTAPNALQSACLPSKNGCSEFSDMKGETCTGNCFCGFNKDSNGICITQVIDNCLELDSTNKQCKTCVQPESNFNYGGGFNDYGRSFDGLKCIDNVSNGISNCEYYREGDQECAKCRLPYYLTATFKCVLPQPGVTIPVQCLVVEETGQYCTICQPWFKLLADRTCDGYDFGPQQDKCVRFNQQFNGVDDDQSACVQCEPGRILGSLNRCSDKFTQIESNVLFFTGLGEIQQNYYPPSSHCVAASLIDDTDINRKNYHCIVRKNEPLIKAAIDAANAQPKTLKNVQLNCNDWDNSAKQCKSSSACTGGSVFNKLTEQCEKTCVPVNCLESEGGRWCNICQPGFLLYEGACFNAPSTVTEQCNIWDPETYVCTKCIDGYQLKLEATQIICKQLQIKGCSKYVEDKCTECVINKVLSEDGLTCAWNVPAVIGGVIGCKDHESDGICKTCYDNYALSDDKKMCTFSLNVMSRCAEKDSKGNCILCNYIKRSVYVDLFGKAQCVELSPANYCDVTFDQCHCVSCKPGFTFNDVGNCYMKDPSDATKTIDPEVAIPGCIKFKSATECEKCKVGAYLLTEDKKCYDLHEAHQSPMMEGYQSWNGQNEPCKKAKNIRECAECEAGFVGLVTWDTTIMTKLGYTRTFCVNNFNDDIQVGPLNSYFVNGAGGSSTFKLIKYCAKYVANKKTGGECETCMEGTIITPDKTGCVHPVDGANSPYFCINYSTAGCVECAPNYFLMADKTCQKSQTLLGCEKVDTTSGNCLSCLKGWTFDSITTDETKKCKVTSSLDSLNMCADGNLGSCLVKKASFIADPNNAGSSLQKIEECSKGGQLTSDGICQVDTSVQTNCESANKYTGLCEKCKEGFFLHIGDMSQYQRKNEMNQHVCIPAVKFCKSYENYSMKCKTCFPDELGNPQSPDGSGWNCVSAISMLQNCDTYAKGDLTKCVQCKENTGELANACKMPIENCETYDQSQGICTQCISPFIRSSRALCVINNIPNCKVPYDSTLCAECNTGFTIIPQKDNKISRAFGQCAKQKISGCVIASEDHNTCLRCQANNYALIDGICFQNDGSQFFPFNCISYGYNSTSRTPYCNECDQGYGISVNNTRCVANVGGCVDSVEKDCFQYEAPTSFEKTLQCKSFSRPGSSSFLSALILCLISLIFVF